MNFDKVQELTETIQRSVEALNQCCRTSAQTQNTQTCGTTSGPMPTNGYPNTTYPTNFGWSPSRFASFPGTYGPNFYNGNPPTQGWNGFPTHPYSNTYSHSGYPTWGSYGWVPNNAYAPVQTFGGTPMNNCCTVPGYGASTPAQFGYGSFGTNGSNCFSGWGTPYYGFPNYVQGMPPTGTWSPNNWGSFPFYGTNGFGFPFFGSGYPTYADSSCVPQGQTQGWTQNCGPTGVVDMPLAA
jgi:hypothetical protein